MIRPLRQGHRLVFVVLALVLPLLLVASLRARPEAVVVDRVPTKEPGAGEPAVPIAETRGCLGAQPARLVLFARENGALVRSYELAADGPLVAPDLLVYLRPAAPASAVPSGAAATASALAGAELLGLLPADRGLGFGPGSDAGAELILYSQGHERLIGTVVLANPPLLEECG